MKYLATIILINLLSGCSSYPLESDSYVEPQACLGTTELPADLKDKFEPVTDEPLLNMALGSPTEGRLCKGQVYQSKKNSRMTIYRAWNSTNPNSKMGNWWAFQKPGGKVSLYRSEYEICYQWSPLDMLVSCTLKPGVKIVIGTGQSAKCSAYLTYPVSDRQQIYLDDASISVSTCTIYDGEFSWKKLQ